MASELASTAYTPQPRGEANFAKTTPPAGAIASTHHQGQDEEDHREGALGASFSRPVSWAIGRSS